MLRMLFDQFDDGDDGPVTLGCGIVGMGLPFHVEWMGPSTFDQLGMIGALLAVAVAVGMFLLRGSSTTRATVAPDTATAMWEDLEAAEQAADEDEDALVEATT